MIVAICDADEQARTRLSARVTALLDRHVVPHRTRAYASSEQLLFALPDSDGMPDIILLGVSGEDEGGWAWDFGELDKFDAGREVSWSVEEDSVRGYESSAVGLDVANTYAVTWSGLPLYATDGSEFSYEVRELSVDGYEATPAEPVADGGTITNKHEVTPPPEENLPTPETPIGPTPPTPTTPETPKEQPVVVRREQRVPYTGDPAVIVAPMATTGVLLMAIGWLRRLRAQMR